MALEVKKQENLQGTYPLFNTEELNKKQVAEKPYIRETHTGLGFQQVKPKQKIHGNLKNYNLTL